MNKSNSKRFLIFSIILLLIVSVSMGYALLSKTVSINGNADITKNTWDIYFDNIVEQDGSVTASNPATIIDDVKRTIEFEVNLDKPKDKYEFIVDMVNDGSIDAVVDSVIVSGVTDDNKDFFDYSVKYLDGTDVSICDVLKAKSRRPIRLIEI